MKRNLKIAALAASLLLAGCVSMPSGPGVMALPGTNKSFDQFRADDMDCRQYASNQVGGDTAERAQADSALKSAAVGTAVGALAGAIVGGRGSVASGAGAGLIVGGVAGAGAGNASGRNVQQRYDYGYVQCMYSRGHRVPAAARFESGRPVASTYVPPPPPTAGAIPPPPPGAPPAPPPGIR